MAMPMILSSWPCVLVASGSNVDEPSDPSHIRTAPDQPPVAMRAGQLPRPSMAYPGAGEEVQIAERGRASANWDPSKHILRTDLYSLRHSRSSLVRISSSSADAPLTSPAPALAASGSTTFAFLSRGRFPLTLILALFSSPLCLAVSLLNRSRAKRARELLVENLPISSLAATSSGSATVYLVTSCSSPPLSSSSAAPSPVFLAIKSSALSTFTPPSFSTSRRASSIRSRSRTSAKFSPNNRTGSPMARRAERTSSTRVGTST